MTLLYFAFLLSKNSVSLSLTFELLACSILLSKLLSNGCSSSKTRIPLTKSLFVLIPYGVKLFHRFLLFHTFISLI